jgi:hypothetical protein
MKQRISGAAVVLALILGYSAQVNAAIMVNINDGDGHSFTCDNGTAAGVTACGTAGFFTNLNSNVVGFIGTYGDYNFGGFSGVNANVPGTSASSFATDSKVSVTHTTGSTDLTVTFAAYGFTLPTGSGLTFSSSDTGNWTTSASTDVGTFTGWADPTNGKTPFVGTAAPTPPCIPTATTTTITCGTQSPNVPFSTSTTYSLIGQEVIHLAAGSNASFTATELVVPTVPEPVSLSLMGIGLLGIGLLRRRLQ